jgi:DNA-binding transcriptional MerR regulator
MEKLLPSIPAKRYFTIGEVSELCGVKPYVLRYWEQEFNQLKPMKRRGNRRYYQHHEVLLIRRIRGLLYDQGFTISGARNRLADGPAQTPGAQGAHEGATAPTSASGPRDGHGEALSPSGMDTACARAKSLPTAEALRAELVAIRDLLVPFEPKATV